MKKLLLIFGISAMIYGQTVRQDINPKQAFIGDPLHYELTIEFQPGINIEIPRFDKSIGNFTILDRQIQTKRKENQPFQNRYIFQVTAFDTGYQAIPAIQIGFTDTLNHQPTKYIMTDSLFVYFNSVLDSVKNIVDIYPPKKLAVFTLTEWLIITVIIIAVSLLFWLGFKRRKLKPVEIYERYISPEEKAEKALAELNEKKFPLNSRFKEFYLELTFILKQYLEERYFVHVLELSTTELLPVLESTITTDEYYALRSLLEGADLVKFAKQSSSIERCDEDFQRVSKLISSNIQ